MELNNRQDLMARALLLGDRLDLWYVICLILFVIILSLHDRLGKFLS